MPAWHGQPQKTRYAFTVSGIASTFGGVANDPPVWQNVPHITFFVGITSTFPISGTYQSNNYVTDANFDTIVITKNNVFVQGVNWDGGKFTSNGTGSQTTVTGHILTADDGHNSNVQSSPFHIAIIPGAVSWTSVPSVSFVEGSTTPYNLGQNILNYNASTDEFRVTPGFSLPSWLALTVGPGSGSGNLTPNGTQVDANDIPSNPGIKIDVRRSGGAWVTSNAFGVPVTVTALPSQTGSGNRVNLNDLRLDGPDWNYASTSLVIPWVNSGGDWRDANGTAQGSTAYAVCSAIPNGTPGQVKTWTVTTLVQRLLADNTGIMLRATSGGGNLWFASRSHGSISGPSLSVTTTNGAFTPALLSDIYITSGAGLPQIVDSSNDRLLAPAFLKFDLSGVTGTVTSAALTMTIAGAGSAAYPAVFGAFYADMPSMVTQPALQLGGVNYGIAASLANDLALESHGSVLVYDRLSSTADIEGGNWRIGGRPDITAYSGLPNARGHTYVPAYESWAEYGLTAARFKVPSETNSGAGNFPAGARLWHYVFPSAAHNNIYSGSWFTPPQAANPKALPRPWFRAWGNGFNELYCRYLLKIDADVATGIKEGYGVKLSGFESVYGEGVDGNSTTGFETLSFRVEHFMASPANPGRFRPFVYTYDWQNNNVINPGGGTGQPLYFDSNIVFETGRIYCIDQYIKLNTTTGTPGGIADGIIRVWVDGVQALNITNRKIRTASTQQINEFFLNVYHGGVGQPNADIDYWMSGSAMATAYIGPPVTPLPTWAAGSTVGQWMDVPGTAQTQVSEPGNYAGAPGGMWYGLPASASAAPSSWGNWQAGNVSARFTAWCGASFRKRGSVLLLGPTGGHGDYYGNWISAVNLGLDTPTVEVVDPGTHWSLMYGNSNVHADLKPIATHSYYSHQFCDERDWLLYFGVAAHGSDGVRGGADFPGASTDNWPPVGWPYPGPSDDPFYMVMAWDYESRTWQHPSTIADCPLAGSANFTAAPHAVHPVTGDIYYGRDGDANGGFYVWRAATLTHHLIAQSYPTNYSAIAIDPKRNRMFFSGVNVIPSVAYRSRHIDCASGLATSVTLTGLTDAVNAVGQNDETNWGGSTNPAYPGMVYVPERDSYFYAISKRTGDLKVHIFEVDAETFECVEYAAAGTLPSAPANGIETKLHYAPELRGLVLMNAYGENVKYLRLW